jgi:hypothetical protein
MIVACARPAVALGTTARCGTFWRGPGDPLSHIGALMGLAAGYRHWQASGLWRLRLASSGVTSGVNFT